MAKEQKSYVLWFTGLSGSGKTTLTKALAKKLAQRKLPCELLDGDELRKIFPKTGFSREERNRHIQRVAHTASLLEKHGVIVLVSLISPYQDSRTFARKLCKTFIEIHLSADLATCAQRDVKGHYKKISTGKLKSFTGVDAVYEIPRNPEIRLDTSVLSINECLEKINTVLKKKGLV